MEKVRVGTAEGGGNRKEGFEDKRRTASGEEELEVGFRCGSNEGGSGSGDSEGGVTPHPFPTLRKGQLRNQIKMYLSTFPFILFTCFLPFATSQTPKFSFPTPWELPGPPSSVLSPWAA